MAARKITAAVLACAAALTATATVAAQPAPNQTSEPRQRDQCFYVNQFQQWRDVDDKTIYIRVNLNDFYRLDMAQSCPELTYPDPHLITTTRGSDTVCSALDWDLRVADGTGPGSFAVPCIVKTMTKLTSAEAATIPKKYKP